MMVFSHRTHETQQRWLPLRWDTGGELGKPMETNLPGECECG